MASASTTTRPTGREQGGHGRLPATDAAGEADQEHELLNVPASPERTAPDDAETTYRSSGRDGEPDDSDRRPRTRRLAHRPPSSGAAARPRPAPRSTRPPPFRPAILAVRGATTAVSVVLSTSGAHRTGLDDRRVGRRHRSPTTSSASLKPLRDPRRPGQPASGPGRGRAPRRRGRRHRLLGVAVRLLPPHRASSWPASPGASPSPCASAPRRPVVIGLPDLADRRPRRRRAPHLASSGPPCSCWSPPSPATPATSTSRPTASTPWPSTGSAASPTPTRCCSRCTAWPRPSPARSTSTRCSTHDAPGRRPLHLRHRRRSSSTTTPAAAGTSVRTEGDRIRRQLARAAPCPRPADGPSTGAAPGRRARTWPAATARVSPSRAAAASTPPWSAASGWSAWWPSSATRPSAFTARDAELLDGFVGPAGARHRQRPLVQPAAHRRRRRGAHAHRPRPPRPHRPVARLPRLRARPHREGRRAGRPGRASARPAAQRRPRRDRRGPRHALRPPHRRLRAVRPGRDPDRLRRPGPGPAPSSTSAST